MDWPEPKQLASAYLYLGLAGTVTEELFPPGTGAVVAKDLSRESIAEAAIPLLRNAQYAQALGSAAAARVNAVFLREHFASRLRRALAPQLSVYEAVATNAPSHRSAKKKCFGIRSSGLLQKPPISSGANVTAKAALDQTPEQIVK